MKRRLTYIVLGIAVGLTAASVYFNRTFSDSFSASLTRVYQLGCAQGVLATERVSEGRIDRGAALKKCLLISTIFRDTLRELMEQPVGQ